jgi:UDP-3-O-[3-hydroxymyristoyl] glucosamine N-acyltransferase
LIILSSKQTSKILYAVSFDTATYRDLECFVSEHELYSLTRISPDDFLSCQLPLPGSYINLVIRDIELRKQITSHLDTYHFDRFSIVHNQSYASCADIALGCMIYPLVSIYPKAVLQRDVIVHSLTAIAHRCQIGVGAFISGGTTIAGNTTIGEFTQIGIDSTIYDQVSIPGNTVVGASTVVRKDILIPGAYSSQLKNNLIKIK